MDFKKIISELSAAGLKQIEIAKACDCSQPTISEILQGEIKNPSFSIGLALVSLHEKVCLQKEKAA